MNSATYHTPLTALSCSPTLRAPVSSPALAGTATPSTTTAPHRSAQRRSPARRCTRPLTFLRSTSSSSGDRSPPPLTRDGLRAVENSSCERTLAVNRPYLACAGKRQISHCCGASARWWSILYQAHGLSHCSYGHCCIASQAISIMLNGKSLIPLDCQYLDKWSLTFQMDMTPVRRRYSHSPTTGKS